jgi:hypothetical protein
VLVFGDVFGYGILEREHTLVHEAHGGKAGNDLGAGEDPGDILARKGTGLVMIGIADALAVDDLAADGDAELTAGIAALWHILEKCIQL